MSEAKPFVVTLVLAACALGWLALHGWGRASPSLRMQQLTRIAQQEEAQTRPPTTFIAQVQWLWWHRFLRLRGVSLLVGFGALVGLAEGIAWRRTNPRAGVGIRSWTLGLMSVALGLGLLGGYIVSHVPLPLFTLAIVGTAWSGATGFLLTYGRPSIA